MKIKKISTHTAYEKYTGLRHVFEVYEKDAGAPYYVILDGVFLTTAENVKEATDEVLDTIKWYDWRRPWEVSNNEN